MVRLLGHPQTKGVATEKPNVLPPHHISDLPVLRRRRAQFCIGADSVGRKVEFFTAHHAFSCTIIADMPAFVTIHVTKSEDFRLFSAPGRGWRKEFGSSSCRCS
jgi:hypothetical protein